MNYKQIKTGFMKRFEGCWRIEPIFIDEKLCDRFKPKTLEDYMKCTQGKGRIGSRVRLDQLIEPSILPPPPMSWYLRGITTRTTEMLIHDFLAEAARIRGFTGNEEVFEGPQTSSQEENNGEGNKKKKALVTNIKERWALRRRNAKHSHRRRFLTSS